MRVNSPAWLYSDHELRAIRENIHFAPISWKYKRMIRNMIKLLALHDVYATTEEGKHYGERINTVRKTKAARERAERQERRYQRSYLHPRPITRRETTGGNITYHSIFEDESVNERLRQALGRVTNAHSSR